MSDKIVVRNAKKNPYVLMDRVLVFDTNYLSIYDKMVYLALCGFADNQTQQSYPSRAKLAEICRCSLSSVKRSLKNLEDLKLINVERRKSEDGQNETNVYTLLEMPEIFGGRFSEDPGWVPGEPRVGSEGTGGGFSQSHKLHSFNYTHLTNNTTTATKENPISFYEQNFGMLSPFQSEQLVMMCEENSDDLVLAAMKLALQKNRKNLKTVEGVLRIWRENNVKTVEDARAYETEFRNQLRVVNGGGAKNGKGGKVYKYSGGNGRPSEKGGADAVNLYQPGKWDNVDLNDPEIRSIIEGE